MSHIVSTPQQKCFRNSNSNNKGHCL